MRFVSHARSRTLSGSHQQPHTSEISTVRNRVQASLNYQKKWLAKECAKRKCGLSSEKEAAALDAKLTKEWARLTDR